MAYPAKYFRKNNYSKDVAENREINAGKLDSEFAEVQESLLQVNTLLRKITTATGGLRSLDANRQLQTHESYDFVCELIGGVAEDTFVFSYPIHISFDMVRVFINNEFIDPISYHLENEDGELVDGSPLFNAIQIHFIDDLPAVGDTITVQIYMNMAEILDRMQDATNPEGEGGGETGAKLIGYKDPEALYQSDNVSDALTEVKGELTHLLTNLGPISDYLTRNGIVTLTGDWSVNEASTPLEERKRIKHMAPSLVDGDAVAHEQLMGILSDVQDVLSGLLPVDGTISMAGDLKMGNNRIVECSMNPELFTTEGLDETKEPLDSDVIVYKYLKYKLSALEELMVLIDEAMSEIVNDGLEYLRLDGSKAMTGDLAIGDHKLTGVAPGTADTDGVNFGQLKDSVESMSADINLAHMASISLGSADHKPLVGTARVDISHIPVGSKWVNNGYGEMDYTSGLGWGHITNSIKANAVSQDRDIECIIRVMSIHRTAENVYDVVFMNLANGTLINGTMLSTAETWERVITAGGGGIVAYIDYDINASRQFGLRARADRNDNGCAIGIYINPRDIREV